MTKAIIFDYFGVISSDEYWDLTGSGEGADDKFAKLSADVNLGKIDWHTFCESVAREKGISTKEVENIYARQRINGRLITYIARLRNKYRIGLLSNAYGGYIHKALHDAGIEPLFESVVISSETGFLKPEPRAYKAILNSMNVEPEEAIMVDDSGANIDGAKDVGMQTVLYEDFETFRLNLEEKL